MRVLFVLFLLCMIILSCDDSSKVSDSTSKVSDSIDTYIFEVRANYGGLYTSYYTNTDYALCSTDNYVVCYREDTQYIIPFTSVIYIKRLKK